MRFMYMLVFCMLDCSLDIMTTSGQQNIRVKLQQRTVAKAYLDNVWNLILQYVQDYSLARRSTEKGE